MKKMCRLCLSLVASVAVTVVAEQSDSRVDRLQVGEGEYSFQFEDNDISHELRSIIISDMNNIFSSLPRNQSSSGNDPHSSGIDFIAVDDRKDEPTTQGGDTENTYVADLSKLRRWLPEEFKAHFGRAIHSGDSYEFVISESLVDAYAEVLSYKVAAPSIFSELDKFVELLNTPSELREILKSPEASQNFIFNYHTSLDQGVKLLDEYLSVGASLEPPSILDIKPLDSVGFGDDARTNVYVLGGTIVWGPNKENRERLPIGAYVDGKWKICTFPRP